MNAAIDVGDGRFLVPGNRWDLLPSPSAPPRVSVVVPYFEQQAQLDRLLTGIEAQTGHVEVVEVIVADDGSPRPPHVPPWYRGPPVTVVTQADEGIRPAAARNLGVTRARGQVVVFLDGDMVPASDYVAGMARLPAVAPDTVVVGTRRHWDLESWDHCDVARWLAGGPAPPSLPAPAWLAEGYRRSRDLVEVTDRSYQLVIGAVMATSVEFFREIGGFDAAITDYGGEDWEFAHRAFQAGALLAHVDAVAHHDGPEWRERVGPHGTKNPERRQVVRTIPGRHDPVIGPHPLVAVEIDLDGSPSGDDRPRDRPWSDEDRLVATVAAFLQAGGTAVAVWLRGPASDATRDLLAHDARVRFGALDRADTGALVVIDVLAPVELATGAFDRLIDEVAPGTPGRTTVADDQGTLARIRAPRVERRARRWVDGADRPSAVADLCENLFGPERRVGAGETGLTRVRNAVDLARIFPR